LAIITPNHHPKNLARILLARDELLEKFNHVLAGFGTGICRLRREEMPANAFFGQNDKHELDQLIALWNGAAREAEESYGAIPADLVIPYPQSPDTTILCKDTKGRFQIRTLVATHKNEQDEEVPFTIESESDGTQRLIDLLAILPFGGITKKPFIVDEIARSLHPALAKLLVEVVLKQNDLQGQFIFTTHESNLLDLDILRQDEIWFAEKNREGATTLYPLSEFKPRYDLDIRKGYLNGRFGAIPFLANIEDLNWQNDARE